MKKRAFVTEYFVRDDLERLKKTITPDWSEDNVKNHLKLIKPHGDSIYEIGAGIGRLLNYLKNDHKVAGCDASEPMIKNQYPGCNISLCDGKGAIPADDASFDFVFSIIVFQHIPNTEVVMNYIKEAYRILKEGGEFAFQVFSHHERESELWTFHDLDVLKGAMQDAGFEVTINEGDRWTIFRGQKCA